MSSHIYVTSADENTSGSQINIGYKTNVTEQESNFTSIPSDCLQLQFDEFIPWDNPDNLISHETQAMVFKFKCLLILPLCFLFGCPANIINMVVFYKQGLKERINLCLFALSLADELSLTQSMMAYSEQLYLQFTTGERFGPWAILLSNNHGYSLIYSFIWISQLVSAIIACDRCFCILQPLRAQNIISTSAMAAFIVIGSLVLMALCMVQLTRYNVQCGIDLLTGNTMMTLFPTEFYLSHQTLVDTLDAVVFGTTLPGLFLVVVMTTTIITTIKLRQAAAWRAATSSSSGLSPAEVAVTKMLVSNSFFFLACVFPFAIVRVAFLILPEMNIGRRQHNIHLMFIWLLLSSCYINSTFNIVVYYTMGSKYRQTFWQLFKRFDRRKKQAILPSV